MLAVCNFYLGRHACEQWAPCFGKRGLSMTLPENLPASASGGPDAVTCPHCGGERWVRTSRSWKRCVCYSTARAAAFVRPIVKQGESTLPTSWQNVEPFGLADRLIVAGGYDDFRYRVWRSLLHYADRGLRYDYFDAYRLNEIAWTRDREYKSLRDLYELDLLVLVVGVADPPSSWMGSLIHAVKNGRKMHGRPTWIYAPSRAALSAPSASPEPPAALGAPAVPAPPTGDVAADRRAVLNAPVNTSNVFKKR